MVLNVSLESIRLCEGAKPPTALFATQIRAILSSQYQICCVSRAWRFDLHI